MFKEFTGYNTPTVEKINSSCTVATYLPLNGKGNVIVGINTSNENNKGIIYLKDNTLINISNTLIIKLLNTLPKSKKKIKNKRTKKRHL